MSRSARLGFVALIASFALALVGGARAEEDPASPPPLVVAVLEFEGPKEELVELRVALPRLLEDRLGQVTTLRLVTRADLDRIQEEQSLNLAGLVADGKGAEVGELVGAQVLVVGRVARIDDEVLLSAKAIGTATGAFLPALVRGGFDLSHGELAGRLADRVRELLVERSGELLPATGPADDEKEAKLRAEIAKLDVKLPRLVLRIPERHLRGQAAPDPAAETALLSLLRRLGFRIAPVTNERQRTWLADAGKGEADFPGPADLEADLVVVGEAFSEFGGRVGRFVSCRARLELRVYDVKTGHIVTTHVGTGSGADLSEAFAGKKALDALGGRAGHEIALTMARTAVGE